MKTLSNILRDADPLRDEAPRTAETRQRLRQRVLSAPRDVGQRRATPRMTVLAAAVLVIAGIVATKFAWQHASVDAVAAVQFEARVAESGLTIVANRDVLTAHAVPGSKPGTFGIELTFTPEGAEKMRRATQEHIGEHLELLVDGKVVMAPLIRTAISTSAVLSGDYTADETRQIIEGLLNQKLEMRNQK
jgi:preprotein translocase subunit SecD